jgi:hypothetical protein
MVLRNESAFKATRESARLLRIADQDEAGPEEGVGGAVGLTALADHFRLGGMKGRELAMTTGRILPVFSSSVAPWSLCAEA